MMSQRKPGPPATSLVVIPGGVGGAAIPHGSTAGATRADGAPGADGAARADGRPVRTLRPSRPPRANSHLTDEQIIDAVQSGNSEVANELYHRLIDAVDITLYRIFGRRERDHEDLIQRSFEQIVLTLSKRSYAGACSLRTWASAVTSRVAFNVLRSKKRERAVLVQTSTEDPATYSKAYVDAEGRNLARAELELLRRHLSKMKPDRAQAVFLHDVLGHELAEIAVMENVTVAAAQSRLVRGRKDLHKRLGLHKTSLSQPGEAS
jgi:RNA polymerase sigma-70 factor (ECF subfamily)